MDPKVLGDMDCRAKQLLVDIFGDEGNATLEKSLIEIMAKANEVLDRISDADKPEKVKVEAMLKTKKNAVLLTLTVTARRQQTGSGKRATNKPSPVLSPKGHT